MTADDLQRITDLRQWPRAARDLLGDPASPAATRGAFGVHWVVAGHHIREQLADDALLVRLLRHMLPPYSGGELILFRGENVQRWERGSIGLAWTDEAEVARMFGRGLNARDSGGLLLRGRFGARAIISGPGAHSRYLGEAQFTVDPAAGEDIAALERYPPIDPSHG